MTPGVRKAFAEYLKTVHHITDIVVKQTCTEQDEDAYEAVAFILPYLCRAGSLGGKDAEYACQLIDLAMAGFLKLAQQYRGWRDKLVMPLKAGKVAKMVGEIIKRKCPKLVAEA